MEKNKTAKYLKYAIGEIILVVIGILIALSINNWNQKQQLFNQEQGLLLEIKNDLNGTKIELKDDISSLNARMHASDSIIEYLNNLDFKEYDNNLFESRLNWALGNVKLYPRTIAYENIKSFGIHLISNDSIRYRLSDFFDRRLTRVTQWEKNVVADEVDLYNALSAFFKTIKSNNQEYKYLLVPDEFDIKSKKLFVNKLAILQNDRGSVLFLYNELLEQINILLNLIEKEHSE
ncbi:hypothetical protein NA63_2237 [Flavobacteriaceae bacterium MAR_2010_105]|nr:hypothetical protein NA63_2237 [Flavobacteriaceae bacterium MAR_2010_105]